MSDKKNKTKSKLKPQFRFSLYRLMLIVSFVLSLGFLGILFLVPEPNYTKGFENLSELQEYAKTIDEWIKMENKNYFMPSYESYYKKKFERNIFTIFKQKCNWLLYSIGLFKHPEFSFTFFRNILREVEHDRRQRGWKGDFVQKIEVKSTSKIVVFGAVQGAFHGLVRYLEQLKKLEILDENLRVKNPDYFLVFLGNVVNRSPYTLEIFSIVLRLLQNNPENVIYLKGTNEIYQYWKEHTLMRELELGVPYFSKIKRSIIDEAREFFDTLPLTLFCSVPYLSKEGELLYFKCSPFVRVEKQRKLLKENEYSSFLTTKSKKKLELFKLKLNNSNNISSKKNIKLIAIVKEILKRHEYQEMDGLRLLDSINGVISWTVFSSSAESYREGLNFYYDAFVAISPSNELKDWLITLYNRDIRNKEFQNFNKRSAQFFSGKDIE